MRQSAFVLALVYRLTVPFGMKQKGKVPEKCFLSRYLTFFRQGKYRDSHPVLPGLQVDGNIFHHLYNMQMNAQIPRKMGTCRTWCLEPRRLMELRKKFLTLHESRKDFGVFMSSLSTQIWMHFSPSFPGKGHQLQLVSFNRGGCIFYKKIDVILEKDTIKYGVVLNARNENVSFFYDDKLFFTSLFCKGDRVMHRGHETNLQLVTLYEASELYNSQHLFFNLFKKC